MCPVNLRRLLASAQPMSLIFRRCLIHGARRRAAESDVVVTNARSCLETFPLMAGYFSYPRHWVIDEARLCESEHVDSGRIGLQGDKISAGLSLGTQKSGTFHQSSRLPQS